MKRRDLITGLVGATALPSIASATNPLTPASGIVRYPDPRIEVLDPRFNSMRAGNAAVEHLYTGTRWGEGPVWFGDGRYLLWSDIPNNRILRWQEETGQVSVFREKANYTNGHCRDLQGRLISCESRRVTRTEYDGTITVLADKYKGKPFNAVNDIVVHPDGSLWFTDPGYGITGYYEGHPAKAEQPDSIYRLDPASGKLTRLTSDFGKPNGLCFSPDFKKLYVVDTDVEVRAIFTMDLTDNGTKVKNKKAFHQIKNGGGDGVRCDTNGNLWATIGWGGEGVDGVAVFAPDGDKIGMIYLPETCANLCFGGEKGNRLFMIASQSVYSLHTNSKGATVL